MKKLLALVLAVVMMMGIASVAFAEETNSLAAVEAAGVLKVGVDAAFAPMTFKDETGAYTGYDIALATAVAEKLGVAVEFVEVDWSNLAAALKFLDKGDAVTTDHYYVILNPQADLTAVSDYVIPDWTPNNPGDE